MNKQHTTHAVCNKHNIGKNSVCCRCTGKDDCEYGQTKSDEEERSVEEIVEEYTKLIDGWEGENLTFNKTFRIKDFIVKTLQAERQKREDMVEVERERVVGMITDRIEASKLIIEATESGDDFEDGFDPKERIDSELSIKASLEELLEQVNQKKDERDI